MKYRFLFLFMIHVFLYAAAGAQIDPGFFDTADKFLGMHVKDGRIDYRAAMKSEHLDTLVKMIGKAKPDQIDVKTRKAFYINAYNLLVIHAVVEDYPINSVLDEKGFFDREKHLVAGKKITLDQLEKEWLFGLDEDPRFHFVLVCGARGCPPIAPDAFRPAKLDAQLAAQTRKAVNDPGFIRLKGNQVFLNQIFEWYAEDFGSDDGAMISFINQYRKEPIPADARIDYYAYDWKLNDI